MTGFSGYTLGMTNPIGISKFNSFRGSSADFNTGALELSLDMTEDAEREQFGAIDIEDRYEAAIKIIKRLNQTQEVLVKIVSSKMTERHTTQAEELIFLHHFVKSFDKSYSGFLHENELRSCLEAANVQFNDDQFTALFAYFDRGCTGRIHIEKFIERIKVPNPKAGENIMSKGITSNR
jgi:hypothetical protein